MVKIENYNYYLIIDKSIKMNEPNFVTPEQIIALYKKNGIDDIVRLVHQQQRNQQQSIQQQRGYYLAVKIHPVADLEVNRISNDEIDTLTTQIDEIEYLNRDRIITSAVCTDYSTFTTSWKCIRMKCVALVVPRLGDQISKIIADNQAQKYVKVRLRFKLTGIAKIIVLAKKIIAKAIIRQYNITLPPSAISTLTDVDKKNYYGLITTSVRGEDISDPYILIALKFEGQLIPNDGSGRPQIDYNRSHSVNTFSSIDRDNENNESVLLRDLATILPQRTRITGIESISVYVLNNTKPNITVEFAMGSTIYYSRECINRQDSYIDDEDRRAMGILQQQSHEVPQPQISNENTNDEHTNSNNLDVDQELADDDDPTISPQPASHPPPSNIRCAIDATRRRRDQ